MSSMSIEAITSSRSCDFPGYKEHERVAKDMERKAVRAKMCSIPHERPRVLPADNG